MSEEAGREAKKDGIASVAANNAEWIARAVALADALLPHGYVMGDQLRYLPGIGQPTRPEAWGALTQAVIRAKILLKTGDFRRSSATPNHAHKYERYWRPGYPNPDSHRILPTPQVPPRQPDLFAGQALGGPEMPAGAPNAPEPLDLPLTRQWIADYRKLGAGHS